MNRQEKPFIKNAVVDTNVFLSALLKSETCQAILTALDEGKFRLFLSEALLEEFLIASSYRKFAFTNERIKEFENLLRTKAEIVEPAERIAACRDAKDNMLLECAVRANADCVVTGDKDLLVLNTFRGIPIIKPQQFLRELEL